MNCELRMIVVMVVVVVMKPERAAGDRGVFLWKGGEGKGERGSGGKKCEDGGRGGEGGGGACTCLVCCGLMGGIQV